jgi:disulfide bond formation protein DsbB
MLGTDYSSSVDTVSLFLALLAVAAELATAAAVVLAVGGRFSPALARLRRQAVEAVAPSALALAAVVAAVCTAGSLYFSEVAHFTPCHLCWLQRFCMYPLVPILGIAAWRRAGWVRPWAAALAFVGACISTYHVAMEHHPEWESSVCDPKNPCTLIWVKRLGYLTIPTMALSGFALVITLLAVSWADARLDRSDPSDPTHLPRSEVHGHH